MRSTDGQTVPERWLAAIVLIGAALMDLVDITIVNVALPTIQSDLEASGTQLQWVVSAYMLAFAATLIVSDFGDTLGRKRVFLVEVAAFGAASLAAGLAQGPGQLIAARVVQGAAAAAMIPRSGRAADLRRQGARAGVRPVRGDPRLRLRLRARARRAAHRRGSLRLELAHRVPDQPADRALASLVAGARVVPETRDPSAGRPDVVGAALLSAALVAIAYPLLEARSLGWPAWVWLVFAAGLAILAALWIIEERRQHTRVAPLLRTRLFRIPAFSAGLTVQFGTGSDPWSIVPGLVVAGAGLSC